MGYVNDSAYAVQTAEGTGVDMFFSSESIAMLDLELETAIGKLAATSCTKHCC